MDVVRVFAPSQQQMLETILSALAELSDRVSETGVLDLTEGHSVFIEKNSQLLQDGEPLTSLGREAKAFAGLAAAVCRRAERRMCTLADLNLSAAGLSDYTSDFRTPQSGQIYLNKLSKLLDIFARN